MAKKKSSPQFLLCVRNDDYPVSLEVRKIYRVVRDPVAATHHLVRVIDESGEDYLYPDGYFVAIKVPRPARGMFTDCASGRGLAKIKFKAGRTGSRPVRVHRTGGNAIPPK